MILSVIIKLIRTSNKDSYTNPYTNIPARVDLEVWF